MRVTGGQDACAGSGLSRRAVGGLAFVFVVSHAVFHLAGVRFDCESLGLYMHFLDPELLKTRLLESCFYLHIQPPLFNLFLGIVLKLGGAASPVLFLSVYLVLGFALYVAVYELQVRLGVGRGLAFVLSTWFMVSPPFILTEHWLFYTFPCAAILTASCVLLDAFLRTGKAWTVHAFFFSLLLLAGLRTVFHLAWFVFLAGALVCLASGHRKKVLVAALVPLILLVAMYAKNQVLFGKFTLCTWSGKHLWIKTVGNMDPAQREWLFKAGILSDVSNPALNRFEATQFYPMDYWDVKGYRDIPALRDFNKSTTHINYNHLAQIAISEQYGKDALYVLVHYPRVFVLTTVQAWVIYFQSNSTYASQSESYARIRPWVWLYDHVFYGKVPFDLFGAVPALGRWCRPQYLFLLLGLPAVWVHGVYVGLGGRKRTRDVGRERRLVLLYMCFSIFYVAFLGTLLEMLETQRFRFMTDPFSVVLLGVFMQYAVRPLLGRVVSLNKARVEL